jgi:hypothetical protein
MTTDKQLAALGLTRADVFNERLRPDGCTVIITRDARKFVISPNDKTPDIVDIVATHIQETPPRVRHPKRRR